MNNFLSIQFLWQAIKGVFINQLIKISHFVKVGFPPSPLSLTKEDDVLIIMTKTVLMAGRVH